MRRETVATWLRVTMALAVTLALVLPAHAKKKKKPEPESEPVAAPPEPETPAAVAIPLGAPFAGAYALDSAADGGTTYSPREVLGVGADYVYVRLLWIFQGNTLGYWVEGVQFVGEEDDVAVYKLCEAGVNVVVEWSERGMTVPTSVEAKARGARIVRVATPDAPDSEPDHTYEMDPEMCSVNLAANTFYLKEVSEQMVNGQPEWIVFGEEGSEVSYRLFAAPADVDYAQAIEFKRQAGIPVP